MRELRRLRAAIARREADLMDALRADLGKAPLDAYTSEIGYVLSDVDHALRNVRAWARPRWRPVPPIAWPGRGAVHPEPFGTALVIGPWNYPFQLLFSPLVSAIAAGNCVCVKPSEYAPHTSRAIASLVNAEFAPELLSVVEGGAEAAEALLAERFDFIFFTGSPRVGRLVMAAAARHLTPVALELGGKCPCLVCEDAKVELAARRILWGKCLNAGQTCVAPDHVLVHESVRERFLDALQAAHDRFFPAGPRTSERYGRIVNLAHFDRLAKYLDDGPILFGGERDREERFLAPTVMLEPSRDAAVMREEIFGPVLPVLAFRDLEVELDRLRRLPRPLALYLFSESRARQDRVLAATASGGVCMNDTISQILARELPFGGIGESGMGSCHGRAGFDCFTHERAVLRRGTRVDPLFRYPQQTASLRTVRRLCGWLLGR
jgi:aldehyde dehydrogenase (NAD+)